MTPLARILELLDGATTPEDRAAALALGAAMLDAAAPEEAALLCLLDHRHHLIVRGGGATLLREALSEPPASPVRVAAERVVAGAGASRAGAATPAAPRLTFVRRGSTRPAADGLVRTVETGGLQAGGVAFSADGASLYTFVWSSPSWLDREDRSNWYSRFLEWRTETGELLREAQVGQFREESGSFAVSPDGRTLAVRDHRCIAIHELAAPTSPPVASPSAASPSSRVRLPKRHELRGSEGPYALSFLDDRRLIGDDSSFELILWDTVTGERLAATHSIGWHGHVAVGDRLFLGGCFTTQRRFLGAHRLPSLASDGIFDDGAPASAARIRCEVIAASPSGRWLVTGDTTGALTLWPVRELTDADARSSPRDPKPVATRLLGRHACEVTALCFVGERRLLSGDSAGRVLEWRLDEEGLPTAPPRQLILHTRGVTGLAAHPRRPIVASAGEDGRIYLWDVSDSENGRASCPPPPIHPMQRERHLRAHPEGVEVITDGVSQVIADPSRPPPSSSSSSSSSPSSSPAQRPEPGQPQWRYPDLTGIELGDLAIVPVDDPGPPQLHIRRGEALLDVIELDLHCGGLCALDERRFALVDGDGAGHVSFWELVDVAALR